MPSSPALLFLEKKLALDAVIGVLGVFMVLRTPGGVDGWSWTSILESLNALIFAAVGVLKGNTFNGGSRNACLSLFLIGLGCVFCLGSVSAWKFEIRDDDDGARGVSRVFIASANVVTNGLADIGVSIGGKLDDLAEKYGWSNSLPGDSYAFGIAGTGGTSPSELVCVPDVSIFGLGVGRREELKA